MKSTFSIIFYLKRQVVKKDGTVPVMKSTTFLPRKHKEEYIFQKNDNFPLLYLHFRVSLHKISCARQFESKLSLRSLAISLHKICCTRQFESNFHCARLQYLCIKIVRYENN